MSSDKSKKHDGPNESKYWHFRCNDTSEAQYEHLVNLDCEYINIGAIEKNKTRSGNHFHTIIMFHRSVGLAFVKKNVLKNQLLNQQDWYIATRYYKTKTLKLFVKYAIKNGSRYETESDENEENLNLIDNNVEINKASIKAMETFERNKLRLYNARILNYEWFLENDFTFYMSSQCKSLFANCQHKGDLQNLEKLDNYFIYGEPGTGKSSVVDFLYEGCYKKIKTNEKWDSYSNYLIEHETVYFDELDTLEAFDKCMGGFEEFKTFTDCYPFPVRSNYGNQQIDIRPKRFIISSNFTPNQILSKPNKFGQHIQNIEMLLKAFHRRFKVMHIDDFHKYTNTFFNKKTMRTEYRFKNKELILRTIKEEKQDNNLMNLEDLRFWRLEEGE